MADYTDIFVPLPETIENFQSVIKDGWLLEKWFGYGSAIEVDEILHEEDTAYQKICIFKSKTSGNVLLLDGITQCTERDEFAYQEMIAHVPLNCHPNPENVLVVGGGDGGVLREVVKHPCVKSVTLCEIDERVITLSKKYLPKMAAGFDDPRVKVAVADGSKFLTDVNNEFDVVITDSSDEEGPNESLFSSDYYHLLSNCLKENGILCCQGNNLWMAVYRIRDMMDMCREYYPVVRYSSISIPTYTTGQIGLILCSKDKETKFESPSRVLADVARDELKYYNSNVHAASFALPQFAHEILYGEGTRSQEYEEED